MLADFKSRHPGLSAPWRHPLTLPCPALPPWLTGTPAAAYTAFPSPSLPLYLPPTVPPLPSLWALPPPTTTLTSPGPQHISLPEPELGSSLPTSTPRLSPNQHVGAWDSKGPSSSTDSPCVPNTYRFPEGQPPFSSVPSFTLTSNITSSPAHYHRWPEVPTPLAPSPSPHLPKVSPRCLRGLPSVSAYVSDS